MSSRHIYLYWVVGLILFEICSWFLFQVGGPGRLTNRWMGDAFLLGSIVLTVLAFRRPVWIVWLSLAELVVGGKGYLLFVNLGGEKISLRYLLFFLVIVAAGRLFIRNKNFSWPEWWKPIAALLSWVGIMSLWGVLAGRSAQAIFLDMNGYLYLVSIFGWWIILKSQKNWKTVVWPVVLAGVTVIGIKSWVVQLVFAEEYGPVRTIYNWIRQTGIGEITYIQKNLYRIFFQNQIFALLGFFVVIGGLLQKKAESWWIWPFLSASLAVYLSLSRSLWLGLICSLVVIVIWVLQRRDWKVVKPLVILLPLAGFVWMMAGLAVHFPNVLPRPGTKSESNVVTARLGALGSSQAATARSNQIRPLLSSIAKNPITGQGFGSTVTYVSTDPRVRGLRTASSFELGYLDTILDIGLVGVALFVWWGFGIWKKLKTKVELPLLVFPTLALFVVHLTSPYLNHPLGLGWLALVTLLSYDD